MERLHESPHSTPTLVNRHQNNKSILLVLPKLAHQNRWKTFTFGCQHKTWKCYPFPVTWIQSDSFFQYSSEISLNGKLHGNSAYHANHFTLWCQFSNSTNIRYLFLYLSDSWCRGNINNNRLMKLESKSENILHLMDKLLRRIFCVSQVLEEFVLSQVESLLKWKRQC